MAGVQESYHPITDISSVEPGEASKFFRHTASDPTTPATNSGDRLFGGGVFPYVPIWGVSPETKSYNNREFPGLNQEIRSHFGGIWSSMFGENGYLADQKPDKLSEDQRVVEMAFAIALYGHQLHKRGTGEAYIWHPLRIAKELTELKVPAHRIARVLLHDVVEDTIKPLKTPDGQVPYPYRVTREDIARLVSDEVVRGVDALTEKRKTQKMPAGEMADIKDITETKYQLISSGIIDPSIMIDKVEDRIDNLRTIHGKPLADQVNIAIDTLETYVPFERIVGLHEKAVWLEDACFRVIDNAAYRDGYADTLTKLREDMLSRIGSGTIAKMRDEVKATLASAPVGYAYTDVSVPGIYELAASMGTRRLVRESDFYLNITVVLSETPGCAGVSRIAETATVPVYLTAGSRMFDVPEHDHMGITEALRDIDADRDKPGNIFVLEYLQNGNRIPVRVRVMHQDEYDLENTPLSYLDAAGLTETDKANGYYSLEKRRQLADLKHQRLMERFEEMTSLGMSHEEIVRQFVLTIPDSIVVFDKRANGSGRIERTRVAIPRDATVLDYALRTVSDRWWSITEVSINGNRVRVTPEILSQILNPGDEIEFPENAGSEMTVTPLWLDAVTIDPEEMKKRVSRKLVERLNVSRDPDLYQEALSRGVRKIRDKFISRLGDRGLPKYPLLVGINKVHDTYKSAISMAYGHGISPEDAFEKLKLVIGTGQEQSGYYGEDLLTKVVDALADYQFSLVSVSLPVKDESGISARVSTLFAKYGINVEKIPVIPHDEEYNAVRLVYVFHPDQAARYAELVQPVLEAEFGIPLAPSPWLSADSDSGVEVINGSYVKGN